MEPVARVEGGAEEGWLRRRRRLRSSPAGSDQRRVRASPLRRWTGDGVLGGVGSVDFVQRYAPQALTDNRVAFSVGIAGRKVGVVELHPRDPASRTWRSRMSRLSGGRCLRRALPQREGGYDWRFCRDRAIAGGEPIAIMNEVAYDHRNTDEAIRHAEIIEAVDAAVGPGDPHAYLMIAGVLMCSDLP